MPEAIANTSPMLYLYRIGVLEWLPQLCDDIWIPQAVVNELQDGQRKGYDVPIPGAYPLASDGRAPRGAVRMACP